MGMTDKLRNLTYYSEKRLEKMIAFHGTVENTREDAKKALSIVKRKNRI